MQFPNNLNLKPANILKIAGLALVAIIVVTLAFRLIGSSVRSLSSTATKGVSQGMPAFDAVYSESADMAYSKTNSGVGGAVALSTRNVTSSITPSIAPMPNGPTIGDDAEEFEVTQYNATIETRNLEDSCAEITALKARDDVIFENASEYEQSCNYSFKVKRESVDEILGMIESMDPKELNANTYTIKQLVDDYTSEAEILEKQMASIEKILTDAVKSYDDISQLATRTKDVESLAKIINSKIEIIERLTQERINMNAQLERLERAKAEQLDRLDYTYFSVYVFENKYIDGQNLKDSWKAAVKSFVNDINEVVQDISINLVSLLFLILQYLIYIFIILIIVKYGWRLAKRLWLK